MLADGCRVFVKEDIPLAVLFAPGVVVPTKVGNMPAGAEMFIVTGPKHDEIMARLQPAGYLASIAHIWH